MARVPVKDFDDLDDKPSGGQKPDPVEIIKQQLLFPFLAKAKRLPAPCPTEADDCARWWLSQMCEPEHDGETFQAAAVGSGQRWETGYATRCRQTLRAFLSLPSDAARSAIVGLVRSGHVYRGESLGRFVVICDEAERMKDMGAAAYRDEAVQRIKAAIGGMVARK